MDVDTDDDILQRIAAGGALDYDTWPQLLCTIVSRIETISHNDFPIPVIPPPRRTQSRLPPLAQSSADANTSNGVGSSSRAAAAGPSHDSTPSSQEDTNKENTDPVPAGPTAGPSHNNSSSRPGGAPGAANGSSPPPSSPPESGRVLPHQVIDLLNLIIASLTTTFAKYPPHSIQRLAELVIAPRHHYRSVASYLHAVNRVISVTSCSNIYPLPPAVPDTSAMSMLANGVTPSAGADLANGDSPLINGGLTNGAVTGFGNDDTLDGALLTPIPWLGRRPASSGDDNNTEEGSSPPSSADSADIAFSTTSSIGGSSIHGGASAPQVATALQHQQHQQQHQQQQQSPQVQQPPPQQQHRMEVRTEATETIDGPNGVGSIETVSVSVNGIPSHGAMVAAVQLQQQRGITQGELLRQEQKAGVVPVSQLARAAAARAAAGNGNNGGRNGFGGPFHGHEDDGVDEDDEGEEDDMVDDDDGGGERSPFAAAASRDDHRDAAMGGTDEAVDVRAGNPEGGNGKGKETAVDEEEEEIPHARGPQEIGAADMGPQPASSAGASLLIGSSADVSRVEMESIDLEAAVGRKASQLPPGTVAAPLVPSRGEQDEGAEGSAASETAGAAAGYARARSTTPKREAEQELTSAVPVKRRKEGHGEDGEASAKDATAGAAGTEADSTDAAAAAGGEGIPAAKDAASSAAVGDSASAPSDGGADDTSTVPAEA